MSFFLYQITKRPLFPSFYRSFSSSPPTRLPQKLSGYHGSSTLYQHEPFGHVSFLDTPPLVPDSPTILGTLSPQGQFNQNSGFIELLHSVFLAAYLDDPYVRDLACSRKQSLADSYVHVVGTRKNNQIINDRDPASIIFSFLASSTTGLPVPNTYERNPALRIHTPLDGFLIFPPTLCQALVRGCHIAQIIEEESKS